MAEGACLRYNDQSPRAAAMPRLRFSLRSFFLFLFVACLIGSNIFTAFENRRLNEKLNESHRIIKKQQAELGELVITDPNKLNAVAIPGYEVTTWRWRLHVPYERDGGYRIRFSTQDVPYDGTPPTSPYSIYLKGGEYEFTAAIRKNRNDDWTMQVIAAKRLSLGSSNSKTILRMAPEHSQWIGDGFGSWIADGFVSSIDHAGSGGTVSVTPGEPMVLLRVRCHDGSRSEVFEPCDGVMIWITEEGKKD